MMGIFRGGDFWKSLWIFASDIKFSHSVFALPFALAPLWLMPISLPTIPKVCLILLAMVTARTFAMGINRWLDQDIDRENPRTSGRMIPSGKLRSSYGLYWTILAAAIFVSTSFGLSYLAGVLSIPLLMILAAYSLLKRVTWITHWYLGLCLGLAPIAVAVALAGNVPLIILILGAGVMFWVAGFDLLYAIQDVGFDRSNGLRSFPAKFSIKHSLFTSVLSSLLSLVAFATVGKLGEFGSIYFIGLSVIGVLIATEHWVVRDLYMDKPSSNINKAFFNINAWISVVYLIFLLGDKSYYG
jgi:4-hydroxybenzoate polyprenyltransferase